MQAHPPGEFGGSVFAWWQCTPFEEWQVVVRSSLTTIPTPTLQEIMAEIPFAQVSILANGSFVIHPRFGEKRYVRCHDDNATTAALKLWLQLSHKSELSDK